MPSDTHTSAVRETSAAIAIAPARRKSFSWSAALAGIVCALALQGLFSLFGLGWGLATIDPVEDTNPFAGLALGAGAYWLITSILSLFAGGYVAAQVSGRPHALPAVLHGITVWAAAALISFWALGATLMTAARTTASAASTVAQEAGAGSAAMIGSAADGDLLPNAATDALSRELEQALRNRDLTMQDIRSEVREMYREVISPQERRSAANIAENVFRDVIRTPGDFSSDISVGLDRMFSQTGPLSAEDREELEAAIADRFDISEAEARVIAERWETRWQEATARVETLYEETVEASAEASQAAIEAGTRMALALALASFLGLLAAAAGGALGTPPPRRDEEDGDVIVA